MRVALVVVLASCNAIYGLDETDLADPNNPYDPRDYDLDGENNFDDNCPSIANADQANADGDGVGDVCDPHPDEPGDRIVERTFFVNPTADAERWDASNFVFEPGLVADRDPVNSAMLRSKRSYEQRFVVVEIVLAAIAWNVNPSNHGLHLVLDDVGGPSATLRLTSSGLITFYASGPGITLHEFMYFPEVAPGIPIRLRLQFDRETKLATAEVGAKQSRAQTTSTLPSGTLYIISQMMAVELYALVVYGID